MNIDLRTASLPAFPEVSLLYLGLAAACLVLALRCAREVVALAAPLLRAAAALAAAGLTVAGALVLVLIGLVVR